MTKHYDLVGVGIGPFNLSLASVLDKSKDFNFRFFDAKKSFEWHSEIMFSDSDMQTSYLKDLVTPVDPTSPYSFLNYLVQNGLFHAFMNTGRQVVTRREFEMYCQWVTKQLEHRLQFDTPISNVDFNGSNFVITAGAEQFTAKNICIGTGITPRIPECTVDLISNNFFHAKSSQLADLNVDGKDVVIIGGGQTGVEIFRNNYKSKWGKAKSIKLITGRSGLQPLDESPFTNEFFTPSYVEDFFPMDQERKGPIVKSQKLASDGNTPSYLEDIYRELYQLKFVEGTSQDIQILPSRRLNDASEINGRYLLVLDNDFSEGLDEIAADVVILCTGFSNTIPKILDPIRSKISFDQEDRFIFNQDFSVKWNGSTDNKVFALNFSRHCHGISEPQTSLMAWRSATIANVVLGEKLYLTAKQAPNFMSYTKK
ncbi:SidA/IucD/PvdA family monooxygenase [Bacteriovorax sp. PP10]|uniref:SidA/IucD/PvdA family monooxygenase n=1 Tax=Bacteriovorax antarcticus TaxID=3088717 RepID=A0ABU5VSR6_9BACT|nr:SidA/IucD/PvdA family monooxygenase [Bacteriovorax sp. PP10]MEA9356096.1 SidA/IucD/PvdA family monooxygenase [Bacteriovorax sp. PP10]